MTMINLKKLTKAQQAKFEQQTTTDCNELEDEATLITTSPKKWLEMEKLGIEPYEQTEGCRWYRVSKSWIKVKKPGKPRGKPINEILETRVPKIHAL